MSLKDLARQARLGPLSDTEARAACDALLDASQPLEHQLEFLVALRERGEAAGELRAFASVLLERCLPFLGAREGILDVCGTGGDRSDTFNISTAAMFVAAGAGARIAKHGNRGITSRCGGADVLEALGVGISASPDVASAALAEAGCCFLFAPHYHPAVKAVAPVRAELARQGRSSIFNLLGPLINPARPDFQLVGIFNPHLLALYGEALAGLGRQRAWALHGTGPDGLPLDEVSPFGTTEVVEVNSGSPLRHFFIDPSLLGLKRASPEDLRGGEAGENARLILQILEGQDHGPRREVVCLNAAAALVVCRIAEDLGEGMARAQESLDSGAARRVLEALRVAQRASPK